MRGDRKVLGVLVKNMKKLGYVGGKVRINHCFNEEAAKGLKELIKEEFANADIKIGKARGLCSFYAEQGGMLIGFES